MEKAKTIAVASDHAGFELKEKIKAYLEQLGFTVEDCGAKEYDAEDDYPQFASALGSAVAKGCYSRGVLFCGSGIGASIAANRFKGVRAALCFTPEMGKTSRAHNDANILVLGARIVTEDVAKAITDEWLNGGFEGGRHSRRTGQLDILVDNC